MKRSWLARLAVLPVLTLALAGCGDKPTPESSAPESSPAPSTFTATGTYKGEQITLTLVKKTDRLSCDGYMYFDNGYVTFWDINNFEDAEADTENFYTCMDTEGNVVFTVPCDGLLSFNAEGITYGEEMDGTYFRINLQGEKTPVSDEEYEQAEAAILDSLPWRQPQNYGTFVETTDENGKEALRLILPDGTEAGLFPADEGEVNLIAPGLVTIGEYAEDVYLYNTDGEMLYRAGFDEIGYFSDGIATFWRDDKMGLIGDDGTIIIPALTAIPTDMINRTPIHEGLIAVQNAYDSFVSIYRITRE